MICETLEVWLFWVVERTSAQLTTNAVAARVSAVGVAGQ